MKTLGIKKFRKNIISQIFLCGVETLLPLITIYIVTCIKGAKGISVITSIMPIYYLVVFASLLIGIGTTNKINEKLALYKKSEARKYLSQGFLLAIINGIVFFLAIILFIKYYFNALNITGEVRTKALEILKIYKYVALITPSYYIIENVSTCTSNKARLYSNAAYVILNITGVYVLTSFFGFIGVGIAYLISLVAAFIVLLIGFLSDLPVKPKWNFSIIKPLEMIVESFPDIMSYLFFSLTGFFQIRLLTTNIGMECLPVFGLIYALVCASLGFKSPGRAATPIIGLYYKEGNNSAIREFAPYLFKSTIGISIVVSLIVFFGSNNLPILFSIVDPEMQNATKILLQVLAPTILFISLIYATSLYLLAIEKKWISVVLILLNDFMLHIPIEIIFINRLGVYSIGISYLLSGLISVLLTVLIAYLITKRNPNLDFPYLLEHDKSNSRTFNYALIKDNKDVFLERLQAQLFRNNVHGLCIEKTMNVVTEYATYLCDKNDRPVQTQWSLVMNENDVRVIVKDDGIKISDSDVERDLADSVGLYIEKMKLPKVNEVNYLKNFDCNRQIFNIKIRKNKK